MLDSQFMSKQLNNFLGLNRAIALKAIPFLARTPLTPNMITSTSLFSGLVSAWLMSGGSRDGFLGGAFFLQLSFILDNCDGGVARLKSLSSVFGMWFDFAADLIVDFAIWIALAFAVHARHSFPWAVPVAFAACVGSLINFIRVVSGRLQGKTGKELPPDPKNMLQSSLHILSHDGDPTFFVWILALAGSPEYFLFLGCIYIHFIWIGSFISDKFS